MNHNQSKTSSPEASIDKTVPIILKVGKTIIPAELNNSRASQALVASLPCRVRLHRYEHDYCGVMAEPLPYEEKDLRNGWRNGDIAFAADGSYLALLYKGEEISQQYGNLVTLGRITAPLGIMDGLRNEILVNIELK